MPRGAIAERFSKHSRAAPRTYRAPGRVNLIGEHTDYNDGLVLPAAIDLFTWLAIAPLENASVVIHSETLRESVEIDLAGPLRRRGHWSDYIAGVVAMLQQDGHDVPGATLLVESDIPMGAGLSSSAALEVAVATALLDIAGVHLDRMAVARLCQRAENDFVGARCGLMDQFIVSHGMAGHALLFDCRSREYRRVPVPAKVQLIVCNTMVKHSHASGGYNARRAECEEILRTVRQHDTAVRSLRDVSPDALDRAARRLPPVLRRRLRHVVTENDRVRRSAAALTGGDLETLGRCMAESHASLRDDYEVSAPELDLMVELAVREPGVHGARMTGGGFGGCTINVVDGDRAAGFAAAMRQEFGTRTGVRPQILVCAPADGAARVEP